MQIGPCLCTLSNPRSLHQVLVQVGWEAEQVMMGITGCARTAFLPGQGTAYQQPRIVSRLDPSPVPVKQKFHTTILYW
jgi:hypothetical protein